MFLLLMTGWQVPETFVLGKVLDRFYLMWLHVWPGFCPVCGRLARLDPTRSLFLLPFP